MKNYKIRKITADDADQFIRLGNLVWRSAYKNIFPEEVFVQRESEERIAKMKAGFAEHQLADDKITYVAEVDGEIVGYLSGALKSECEYFASQNCADLQGIYVHPNYQHIGIGKKFFDIFVWELKKRKARKFVIGVLQENKQARKAYEKWGGVLSEYVRPLLLKGDEYTEVYYIYDTDKLHINDSNFIFTE